ncbi:hypothetical protein [Clostridioides difficile]|uniref:hypothetical protein n=1 Tax=Clostridioides difficile TaxID=1496 RepID=UPI0018AC2B65|nr:hypothetical protein [Clostridioides difficile]MBF8994283.1 hypothetical protein [Clostridioides difficile]
MSGVDPFQSDWCPFRKRKFGYTNGKQSCSHTEERPYEDGFPKCKSKKINRFSYKTNFTNGNIMYCGQHIKLPKHQYLLYYKNQC